MIMNFQNETETSRRRASPSTPSSLLLLSFSRRQFDERDAIYATEGKF